MTPNLPLRAALSASAARTPVPPMPDHSSLWRDHAADRAALDALVYGTGRECPACFGEGGFVVYPSEHSARTRWDECRECNGLGRVLP